MMGILLFLAAGTFLIYVLFNKISARFPGKRSLASAWFGTIGLLPPVGYAMMTYASTINHPCGVPLTQRLMGFSKLEMGSVLASALSGFLIGHKVFDLKNERFSFLIGAAVGILGI